VRWYRGPPSRRFAVTARPKGGTRRRPGRLRRRAEEAIVDELGVGDTHYRVIMMRAVLFDFGGVILTSPFASFQAYETARGLPPDFVRSVVATDPDTNAWAMLERGQISIDEFAVLFAAESGRAGFEVDGRELLSMLRGEVRPEMAEAVRRCSEHFKTGLLTNNFLSDADLNKRRFGRNSRAIEAVLALFDVVVESHKLGMRKPERGFYLHACRLLDIEPAEAVFLDDLGVNLKPARELGMQTIKVTSVDQALAELEATLAIPLR
jgi:putative hydrolase of the HAD superfamily